MSRYSGAQGKGAAKRTKETKRIEAEVRNEATPPERRRKTWSSVLTQDSDVILSVEREEV